MTDLEMTKLCAEAMGYESIKLGTRRGPGREPFDTVWVAHNALDDHLVYEVLSGLFADAQAMALVKKFWLHVIPSNYIFLVCTTGKKFKGMSIDINRAIVECVANMQKGTTS